MAAAAQPSSPRLHPPGAQRPGRLRLSPAPALVWLAAMIALLAAAAPFAAFAAAGLPLAVAALVAALLLDAALSRGDLPGLRIAPAAAVVRMTEHRPMPVAFVVTRPPRRPRLRSIRLAFHGLERVASGAPAGLLPVSLAPGTATRWEIAFLPAHRGVYGCCPARVAMPSRLRLWTLLGELQLEVTLRVYPDWRHAWRAILASPLAPLLAGQRRQIPSGPGSDFDRLREYLPGDAYTDLSWKSTARRDAPVTRLYQWERSEPVYVVVDHARLSALPAAAGADPPTQLDLYMDAALALLTASHSLGDALGLAAFADQPTVVLRASTGQFRRARESLIGLRSRDANPDFERCLAQLATLIRRRSRFLILTDVTDPGAGDALAAAVTVLCRRHAVSVHALLPGDVVPLWQPGQPGAATHRRGPLPARDLPAAYRRLAGHREYLRLDAYRRRMRQAGVIVRYARPEQFPLSVLDTYFDAKRRSYP